MASIANYRLILKIIGVTFLLFTSVSARWIHFPPMGKGNAPPFGPAKPVNPPDRGCEIGNRCRPSTPSGSVESHNEKASFGQSKPTPISQQHQ